MKMDLADALYPLHHLKCPWCSGFGHKASTCETGNKVRNAVFQNDRASTFVKACAEPLVAAQRQRSLGQNVRHSKLYCCNVGKIVNRALKKKAI